MPDDLVCHIFGCGRRGGELRSLSTSLWTRSWWPRTCPTILSPLAVTLSSRIKRATQPNKQDVELCQFSTSASTHGYPRQKVGRRGTLGGCDL